LHVQPIEDKPGWGIRILKSANHFVEQIVHAQIAFTDEISCSVVRGIMDAEIFGFRSSESKRSKRQDL
jgi:hypothetical protein